MDDYQDNFSSDPIISLDHDNIEKVGKRMLGLSIVAIGLGTVWAIASPIISVLTLKKVNKLNNKIDLISNTNITK